MSAESRPDCPDGVLEAMEPSIFTPRTKRSTLTPGGGSRSVSGHFPAAGEAAGTAGRPWPAPSPCPDDFAFPPPQATATRATTTNTRRRGDRIIRMGPRYCTDPGSSAPLCGACAGSACSQLSRPSRRLTVGRGEEVMCCHTRNFLLTSRVSGLRTLLSFAGGGGHLEDSETAL